MQTYLIANPLNRPGSKQFTSLQYSQKTGVLAFCSLKIVNIFFSYKFFIPFQGSKRLRFCLNKSSQRYALI